jgi:phosphoglycolate phosphatase
MGGRTDPETDVLALWDAYQLDWLRTMAQYVSLPTPDADSECIALAKEASIYTTERVQAAFPGVIETLRLLHAEGYTLNTASNQVSHEMDGYLRAMNVRDLFPDRVYGQDLLRMSKGHPLYYERLFADTNVAAADALVVDDSPLALANAASVGASTILVAMARPEGYEGPVIGSLVGDMELNATPLESERADT